jgi:hypothetical protein
MIKAQLRGFIECVTQNKMISADNVKHLTRSVMEDGISTRDEVEALLALDRMLAADASWSRALTHLVVDFVVWGARPTGYVTADDARWLVSVLDVGGSTPTAKAIAAAVVAEAQEVDETLVAFVAGAEGCAPQVLAA